MASFLAQSVLVSVGVFLYPMRIIAIFLQSIFCLLNFGVVIVTSVFRFNTVGKLAALSLAGSTYEVNDGKASISTERTYADDGELILRLWIISLICVIAQCLLACYAAAPPTQDKLREWGVKINNDDDEEEERQMEYNVENMDDSA